MCRSKLNIILLSLALLGGVNQVSANEEPEVQTWDEFKEECREKATAFKERASKIGQKFKDALTVESTSEPEEEEDRDRETKEIRIKTIDELSEAIDELNKAIKAKDSLIATLDEARDLDGREISALKQERDIKDKRIAALENSQIGHSNSEMVGAGVATVVVAGAAGFCGGRMSK